MGQSIDQILSAFQEELAVPNTHDRVSESFESIYDLSSLHFYLEAREVLRDVLCQLDLSITTIEEWERRDELRGLQSRWPLENEERYGEKVRYHTWRCKTLLQKLRVQQSRLGEQQRSAEQWHGNLVGYMQLQEARISTRSAEDVRLFTYVTIVFLPLSFSSSLFSMQGKPSSQTVSTMATTTVVALAITFFVLAHLKLLGRHWTLWASKITAKTRKEMAATKHWPSLRWGKISRELNRTARRRLVETDSGNCSQAESKWWYFLFWLFSVSNVPRNYYLHCFGIWRTSHKLSFHLNIKVCLAYLLLPVYALISMVLMSVTIIIDLPDWLRVLSHWLTKEAVAISQIMEKLLNGSTKESEHQMGEKVIKEGDTSTPDEASGDSTEPQHLRMLRIVVKWLESPPRAALSTFREMARRLQEEADRSSTNSDSEDDLLKNGVGLISSPKDE